MQFIDLNFNIPNDMITIRITIKTVIHFKPYDSFNVFISNRDTKSRTYKVSKRRRN